MPDKEPQMTSDAEILKRTASLPDIPSGSYPLVYDQVISNADPKADAEVGRPDPAHID